MPSLNCFCGRINDEKIAAGQFVTTPGVEHSVTSCFVTERLAEKAVQSQIDLTSQLWAVARLAERHGYYDAADFIKDRLKTR